MQSYRNSRSHCEPMSKDETTFYAMAIMAEKDEMLADRAHLGLQGNFAYEIAKRRVEAFNLPLQMHVSAYMGIVSLSSGLPGRVVCILVDMLNNPKDKWTASELAKLYPYGFYKEGFFGEIGDNILKERAIPHAEIY